MKSIKPYLPYLAVLIMVMFSSIPLGALQGIVYERNTYKNQVEKEISNQWGGALEFGRIQLSVPYIYTSTVVKDVKVSEDKYEQVTEIVNNTAVKEYAANEMVVESDVKVEKRYKGIYEVPIYRTKINSKLKFNPIQLASFGNNYKRIKKHEVKLQLGLTPGKEINELKAKVNGVPSKVLSLGDELILRLTNYDNSKPVNIELYLDYNGTRNLSFEPSAKKTQIMIESNWKDPKFQGDRLPTERTVTDEGFSASWSVQNFGNEFGFYKSQKSFGVNLFSVLDIYHVNTRTMKYGKMFIYITIFTLFFIQFIRGAKTHPIQYGLIILSMVEFFYILVSFSEHMSYRVAYAIASFVTILTLFLYARNLFKDTKIAAAIGAELTLLYTFLYFTVESQDYALLIGSVGLFVIITASMYLTRNVDWSKTLEAKAL